MTTSQDSTPEQRSHWRKKNSYYYKDIDSLYSFLIYPGSSVLELGCGTGELLEHLRKRLHCPCTGIDSSRKTIQAARRRFKQVHFKHADATTIKLKDLNKKFDVIILSDLLEVVSDVQDVFSNIRQFCHPGTRVIINFYNFLWEPVLEASKSLGFISPTKMQNWLSVHDVSGLLNLADFEVVKCGSRLLFPKKMPLLSFISTFLNKYVARLPLIRKMCLYNYIVARPRFIEETEKSSKPKSVSVIIPARNEQGNIEQAVLRTPSMGSHTEIIFIEGNSTDDTYAEIKRITKKYGGRRDIRYAKQPGKGKGDAVRKGFDMAHGDILMILDADLTVPPEDLPKFYGAIASGKGEFINGTRLVYPMEKEAMRALNLFGNKMFSIMFTWLLDQRFKDTLCGTKVISTKDYARLKKNRLYFGDFDPFGDFDLIFGASKLNLKIVEVPIHYKERTYGKTNISRFKHGWLLIKMCGFAMRKIKFT